MIIDENWFLTLINQWLSLVSNHNLSQLLSVTCWFYLDPPLPLPLDPLELLNFSACYFHVCNFPFIDQGWLPKNSMTKMRAFLGQWPLSLINCIEPQSPQQELQNLPIEWSVIKVDCPDQAYYFMLREREKLVTTAYTSDTFMGALSGWTGTWLLHH